MEKRRKEERKEKREKKERRSQRRGERERERERGRDGSGRLGKGALPKAVKMQTAGPKTFPSTVELISAILIP